VFDELEAEWAHTESDPLVRRLRNLEWTDVSTETRLRCWTRFSDRLAALDLADSTRSAARCRDVGDRYEFSVRRMCPRPPFAHEWSRGRVRALA